MKALVFIETDGEKAVGRSIKLVSAVKALNAKGHAIAVGNKKSAEEVAALGIPVTFVNCSTDCDTLTEVLK
ncbi:hypothetical protein CNEO4_640003 [Clostridium neonatale]|nr:hypothetical protein CNEO4_640003 [Clostridium neonatale]